MDIVKIDIPKPNEIHRMSNSELLLGLPVPPIQRLQLIDEDTYEEIVLCWCKDYVNNKYETIYQFGGAGDKGRDVCAYVDFANDVFDLYQCKHYDRKIGYSDVQVEFGKLLYYTFSKQYKIPRSYFFVAPQGISTALHDLIKKPTELKAKIILDWNDKIGSKITSKIKIDLTQELTTYIDEFDFKIIDSIEPINFLEQFKQTMYFPYYFGGGLRKKRNLEINMTDEIKEREINYVSQLFNAYEDHTKNTVSTIEDIENNTELKSHFDRSRNCFYLAETLAQFSRDNIPTETDPFNELKDEVYEQVVDVYNQDFADGYKRVIATTKAAKEGSYQSNVLYKEIKAQDKTGICHHLANEYKFKWVKE